MADELVTIGSYSTAYEANLVRSELEAFGLDASLLDAGTVNLNWLWSNALGGVKVQVPESELEDARRILALEPSNDEDGPAAEETAPAVCPNCGSRDVAYLLDKRGCFLTWLLFSLPLVPALSKLRCAHCGRRWKLASGSPL